MKSQDRLQKEMEEITGLEQRYGGRMKRRTVPTQNIFNETFESFTSKNFS